MILFGKAGTAVGGFNGAASARSRKSEGYDRLRGRNVASMGPRARARGNGTRRRCRNSQKFSFNGAASARSRKCPRLPSQPAFQRLQWGRERALAEIRKVTHRRAADTRLHWGRESEIAELVRDEERRLKGKELQWGRERALAEIEQLSDIRARLRGASMGPRARARGNPTGNVAAATGRGLQWGRERALAEIAPCPSAATSASWLQWGRERALAEMWRLSRGRMPWVGFNGAASARSRKCARRTDPHRHGAASMGPRARARGNKRAAITVAESVPASMGPRARARGNLLRCPIG